MDTFTIWKCSNLFMELWWCYNPFNSLITIKQDACNFYGFRKWMEKYYSTHMRRSLFTAYHFPELKWIEFRNSSCPIAFSSIWIAFTTRKIFFEQILRNVFKQFVDFRSCKFLQAGVNNVSLVDKSVTVASFLYQLIKFSLIPGYFTTFFILFPYLHNTGILNFSFSSYESFISLINLALSGLIIIFSYFLITFRQFWQI